MADRYANPSAFSNAMAGIIFRLAELNGHAGRTSATIVQKATLASAIMPDRGRINGFRMQAIEAGTTSSVTFNTVGLFRARAGSITYTSIATIRTNRGANAARVATGFSGATALVQPGDILVIRRLTKLNTASQLFVGCDVNREVT